VKPAGRLSLLLMLLLAAVFALSACGGDDNDDFVSDADDICKEAEDKIDEIDRPSSVDEIPGYVDEVNEIADDTKADLEDLDPPSDVEDDWNNYLDNVDEGIELLNELSDAAEQGDEQAVQELSEGERADELQQENEEIAEDIGFEQCGREDN
jgi:hypothetical protein